MSLLNKAYEEMAMLGFYTLFQLEDDEELLKYYNNTRKTMKGIGKRGSRLGGGAMNRMMGQFMNR